MYQNHLTIVGHVTKDPDTPKEIKDGSIVLNFTVAVNSKSYRPDGTEGKEAVTYFDCQAWGPLATNLAKSISKGTRLVVVGEMVQRDWTDKETGAKRQKLEFKVQAVGPDLRFATAKVTKTTKED